MSLTGNNILGGASGDATNQPVFTIDQSLRFDDGDSAYLNRTPGSAGNRRTYTWSGWIKRPEGYAILFAAGDTNDIWQSSSMTLIGFYASDDTISFFHNGSYYKTTTQVFRDPSAWAHLVVAVDTTISSTATDRVKMFWNGERITTWSTDTSITQDTDTHINNTYNHVIGGQQTTGGVSDYSFYDGYLAEVHFIDGQQLTPSSFGEEDSDTGQWKPKKYSGTYGTNGFYQKYQDSSALGDDSSGNGNDFTSSGLAATAVTKDSPSNNFCTLNPLSLVYTTTIPTYAEGNLYSKMYSDRDARGTMAMQSGKWYWEILVGPESGGDYTMTGISDPTSTASMYTTGTPGVAYYAYNGHIYKQAAGAGYGASYTDGDIISVAFNMDDREITFYKNNSSQGVVTGVPSSPSIYVPALSTASWSEGWMNFGQDSSFAGNKTAQGNADDNGVGDFFYEPPSGFLALCSENLPSPEIADPTVHMNTVTYAGTGASQTIAVGFQPDLVWAKSDNTAVNHVLYDSVRGTGRLESNTTNAEGSRDGFAGFDSNGFDVDDDGGGGSINYPSGRTYVAWNWKGGGTAVTNDDGSIDSEVSANTTAGFSIVSYTGTGSTTTIGHGLSQAPEFLVVKNRTTGSTAWQCGSDFIVHATPWSRYITLSSVAAETNSTQMWNDTAPTSSVFTVKDAGDVNTNTDEYIAYCFHSVEGYSKVGTYTGNGDNDGAFVYTGFRPMWVMAKVADQSGSWLMTDSVRFPYNVTEDPLFANESSAETNSSTYAIDIVSNGFKCRGVNNNTNNSSNDTYIYLAFAESPFKTANAR